MILHRSRCIVVMVIVGACTSGLEDEPLALHERGPPASSKLEQHRELLGPWAVRYFASRGRTLVESDARIAIAVTTGLEDALWLHLDALEAAADDDVDALLRSVHDEWVINLHGPGERGGRLEQASAAAADYAFALGYSDFAVDDVGAWLHDESGWRVASELDTTMVDSADAWLATLGAVVNEAHFGLPAVVHPKRAPDVVTHGYDPALALLAAHASELAYRDEGMVRRRLDALGMPSAWTFTIEVGAVAVVVTGGADLNVVSFRGSDGAADWATNVAFAQRQAAWSSSGARVHGGFDDALETVWDQVAPAIAWEQSDRVRPVLFTGHSLGGALAQLAATRAVLEGLVSSQDARVYTFGSPRAGDAVFADVVAAWVPATYRHVNVRAPTWGVDSDPVTAVPPRWLGFRHAGARVEILDGWASVIHPQQSESTTTTTTTTTDRSDPADREVEAFDLAGLEEHMAALPVHEANARGSSVGVALHRVSNYLDGVGRYVLAERNLDDAGW
ncbi:MAG: lipase family protein [Deltaproteobacteria bacterium]|nr:lipase family protein [Deltaproteobacteria bacterium]